MEVDIGLFIESNLFLTMAFAGLVVAIVMYEFRFLTRKYTDLTPPAAVTVINGENPQVLDVREDSEVGERRIGSARHIPGTLIEKRTEELDQARPTLVYCSSGLRSHGICRVLTKRGFAKVYNLKGGFSAWEQAGLPVQKGRKKGEK